MSLHPKEAQQAAVETKCDVSLDNQSAEHLGLYTLREPEINYENLNTITSPRSIVDVIFIHGLGGSSRKTWTHPISHGFWPTWLPDVSGLEDIRISTFGYDAGWGRVWTPKNTLGIREFADELLGELELHYEEKGDVLQNAQTFLIIPRLLRFILLIVWEGWC